ncbi:MAG: hypothetical protein J6O72_01655 [Lachnospira sp.]|jgi:hypothetical protein|nr:hypothetical protein [Lachnospira sp.]
MKNNADAIIFHTGILLPGESKSPGWQMRNRLRGFLTASARQGRLEKREYVDNG